MIEKKKKVKINAYIRNLNKETQAGEFTFPNLIFDWLFSVVRRAKRQLAHLQHSAKGVGGYRLRSVE